MDTKFYDAHQTEQEIQPIPASPAGQVANIPKVTLKHEPNYKQLHPSFGWFAPDIIQKTFEHTTQYARLPGTMLKKIFKSPNLALNVYHCNEAVACDLFYSDIPAVYYEATAAVIFIGVNTQVAGTYGIKKDSHFKDNIIQRGDPNKLISDHSQSIVSHKVAEILCT
jgi:hypothetical protein